MFKMSTKRPLLLLAAALVGLAALAALAEVSTRLLIGFPPTYVEFSGHMYLPAPNQHTTIYHNEYATNSYSMRSKEPSSGDEGRVLLLGDSVLNGTVYADQKRLASSLLEEALSRRLGKNIRVLNASAGGWSPDSAFAYLERYGHFQAKVVVLVFSSHDRHDNAPSQRIVGVDSNYPGTGTRSMALFCARKLLDRWFSSPFNEIAAGTADGLSSGWGNIVAYCAANNIKLLAVLHPTTDEIGAGRYSQDGQEIIAFLQANRVEHLLELDNHPTPALYRDGIHYNDQGQEFLARELFQMLEKSAAPR